MVFNDITDRDDAAALIPEDAANEILGAVAETSAVARVARQLPTMSRKQRRIPVWETLPYAYFVNGDTGLKQTTKAAWRNVYINAEEIAVIVPVPDSVLDDADFPIFERAQPHIVEAVGQVFDLAVLYGTNKPALWPNGVLTQATAAGHVVTAGSLGDTYDDLLGEGGVLSLVEEDGYMVNGHLAALGMKAKLRGLRDDNGTGQPIFSQSMQQAGDYVLDGERLLFPKNGAVDPTQSLLISGDWSQLVWAVRQDITYKVLTEAVITDSEDNIIFNLAQQDMTALRVVFRAGWALPNPVNRVNPNDATRFPFAVYAPAGSGS
jgi:HK97 family phage major capsid protein